MESILLSGPKRESPEIKPEPDTPVHPSTAPEISPRPEKQEPYHPSPEIKPSPAPEIRPGKEKL